MSKIVIILVIAVAVCVNGVFQSQEDFLKHAHDNLYLTFPDAPVPPKPVASAAEIKSLEGGDGAKVSGNFSSSSSSFKSVNGNPVKNKAHGESIKNNNGKVNETSY